MPFTLTQIIALISLAIGTAVSLSMLIFAIVSWREEEPQATKRATLLAVLLPLPYLLAGWLDWRWGTAVSAAAHRQQAAPG